MFAIHLTRLNQPAGWLVGEFSLEEMWRMVDRIRIGEHGFALVVAPDGELIAHGDPDKKALVAQARNMSGAPAGRGASATSTTTRRSSLEYTTTTGASNLGVAARIPPLGWTVIVEQPTSEAYANATQLRAPAASSRSCVALLVMVVVGYLFGRSFITPILHAASARRTTSPPASSSTRVDITTGDEFARPRRRRSTRWPTGWSSCRKTSSGRSARRCSAASPPAWSTTCRIRFRTSATARACSLRDDVDAGVARTCSGAPSSASSTTLKRFMDDLRNVVKPKPIERFAMDVNAVGAEIVESMRPEGERNGVAVEARYAPGPLVIDGDRFALGRVYRNLITNAIQATAAGRPRDRSRPRASATTSRSASTDTGSGIPADRLSRDLRRLRHDQAPRPRPRPGHLQAHRRAARRHDRRRERGRAAARRSRCGFRRATIVRSQAAAS